MLPFNREQNKRSGIVFLKRLQLKIRFVFTLPIIIYQRVFSSNFIPLCRFVPSCSEYTRHAILKYGVIRGIFYGALRILRCGPFSKGGYDPLR